MNRPLRLLYCLPSLSVGGAQRRVAALANAAAAHGHRVLVLTARPTDQPVLQPSEAVEQVCLGRPGRLLPGGILPLMQAIRSFQPDVYHGFLNVGAYYGVLAARAQGVPLVVAAATNLARSVARGALEHQVMRFSFRRAHYVTVNSRLLYDTYAEWLGVSAERIEYIPNFLDAAAMPCRDGAIRREVRAELGLRDGERLVLTVGRLDSRKGHDDMILAAARLAQRHPDVCWNIVGEGAERPRLEALLAQHGARQVRLLGQRRDVPRLLQAADLFTLPSHEEGMSNALLEAMAAGLPAVATAISGSEELVEPGRTGWLVPPAQPEALATAYDEALSVSDERLAALGRAARERIERDFDQPVVVQRYFDFYTQHLPPTARTPIPE